MGLFSLFADTKNLANDVSRLGIRVVLVSSIALFVLVLVAGIIKNKPNLRLPLFALMTFIIFISTATLSGSTIYINTHSESGGPVHWRADFEIWACGRQLELRNPTGFLSNKIGTPSLHEQDDQQIHFDGILVEKSDASLGHFLNVIGGSISDELISIPLADSITEDQVDGDEVSTTNINSFVSTDVFGEKTFTGTGGQKCGDEVAKPQVFVYQFNKANDTYIQTKLFAPNDYVIHDSSQTPPGDCIIMEFAPDKPKTDKLCKQYGIRDTVRCADFGVTGKTLDDCNINEVNNVEKE